ncbi:MAG: flagellar motor protein MotD [Chromatiales bacterium]|nr:flagellar motor protein MotD [Chromatiales bacterium]
MARRRRQTEEHENHERWLVSYADFITLLFAFFVVMYSISSVNEGKYRVLSDALVNAFRDPARSLDPIQVGELAKAPYSPVNPTVRQLPPSLELPLSASLIEGVSSGPGPQAEAIADEVQAAMQPLIDNDLIDIRRLDDRIEVEIKTSILFDSGSASAAGESTPVLRRLAEILRNYPNRIHVEGFTDNLPINTLVYPSNWELSAARAATVVRILEEYGVDPARLAATGFGEHQPVADNATAEGRSANRRVVLVVMGEADDQARRPAAGLQP